MDYARLTPGLGFRPLQSLFYYSQRIVVSPWLRTAVIWLLRRFITARVGTLTFSENLSDTERMALDDLRKSGYAPLVNLLDNHKLKDIFSFLSDKHLRGKGKTSANASFRIDEVPAEAGMADYDTADIINCPHILELANSPILLRIATDYLGCTPTICSLGLRWSFPKEGPAEDLQRFHRDVDDWRFLKIFVYLTDVNTDSGPHVYVKGTHLTKASIRLRWRSDREIEQAYGSENVIAITGPSGFGFAVDTFGIHKGFPPQKKARLMLTIQYSLLPYFAYRYKPERYKGELNVDPYINRLFVKSEKND